LGRIGEKKMEYFEHKLIETKNVARIIEDLIKLKKSQDKINLYYAHHMRIYGTDREKSEIELIKKHFYPDFILNPGALIEDYTGMESFLLYVRLSDIIVASGICEDSYDSGLIVGKGVYMELGEAAKLNKVIYFIHQNTLKEIDSVHELNTDSWRRFAEVVLVPEITL